MRSSTRVQWLALLFLFLPHRDATSAELAPLTAAELHKLCLDYSRFPQSSTYHACEAYLRGFIEGSPYVHLQLPRSAGESFTERAFRTRYGAPGRVRPRYCVNGSVTLNDLVIQVLVQAESQPPSDEKDASVLIESTLNRFHRCGSKSIKLGPAEPIDR